jgi:hypothetical protein
LLVTYKLTCHDLNLLRNNLDPATNVFIPHHEKKSGHFLDRVEAAEHLKVRREVLDLLGDFASALPDVSATQKSTISYPNTAVYLPLVHIF